MRHNPSSKYFPDKGKFRELRPEEFPLSALLDGITDYGIAVFDSSGRVVSWNRGAEKISGYSSDEIIGQRNEIFYSKEDRQSGLPALNLKRVLEQGRYECSSWRIRKDGSPFLANIVFTSLLDTDQHVIGFSTITRDITEQQKRQNKLIYTGGLMDDISDSIISMTSDFKLKYWNKASEKLYGFTSEEVLGKPVEEVLSLRLTEAVRAAFREALKNMGYWKGEVIHVHKNTTEMTILVTASQTLSDLDEPNGYVMVCKDISDRKKLEDQLKNFNESLEVEAKEHVRLVMQSEKKYKMLFESNPMPMWMLSLETLRTIDVNQAALRHYGYTREEFLALESKKMRPAEEEHRFLADLQVRHQGISNRGHWLHRKKNGDVIHVEVSVHDFASEAKPTRLVIASDITAQVGAEEKLKQSYEEIRELASHLQDIREEERAWIAREIHDELGQQLTGLKMDFSWLSRKMTQENDLPTQERIKNSLSLLDDTIRTVRRIATELRPGILDDLGLVPAIEWQAEEFQKRSSIPTRFNTDAQGLNFSAGISIGLFRICQESLTNIARHANASCIQITLSTEGENIFLCVSDNGKGIQQGIPGERKTLGLLGMKERALMMGGRFEIQSSPGNGTSVQVTIPYNIIG